MPITTIVVWVCSIEVPIMISVCSNREREEKMYGMFSREFGVKPVRLDVSPILYSKCVIDEIDTMDSLESSQLRSLGIRSLYYRRSYLLHMAIWIYINEGRYIRARRNILKHVVCTKK